MTSIFHARFQFSYVELFQTKKDGGRNDLFSAFRHALLCTYLTEDRKPVGRLITIMQ